MPHVFIDTTPPQVYKELRPDFDYDCECGYFICDTCGYPAYPAEVDTSEDGYEHCNECARGDMIQSRIPLQQPRQLGTTPPPAAAWPTPKTAPTQPHNPPLGGRTMAKKLRTRATMQKNIVEATDPADRAELLEGLQTLPEIKYHISLYKLAVAGRDVEGTDSPVWYKRVTRKDGTFAQLMSYDSHNMSPEQTATYVKACRIWNT